MKKKLLKIDLFRLSFDVLFVFLAALCFYSNFFVTVLSVTVILIYALKSSHYDKNLEMFYLNHFIDFLNQINSNLCIGMGFDTSVITSAKILTHDNSYSTHAIHQLSNSIKIGINTHELFQQLQKLFPIQEAQLFCRMMQMSKETGSNPSEITEITIDKLYLKHKITDEIETILYQKKLEQSILCLAPMFIILFIKTSSPEYLSMMYQSLAGTLMMTVALLLVLIMKFISEKIVSFKI